MSESNPLELDGCDGICESCEDTGCSDNPRFAGYEDWNWEVADDE